MDNTTIALLVMALWIIAENLWKRYRSTRIQSRRRKRTVVIRYQFSWAIIWINFLSTDTKSIVIEMLPEEHDRDFTEKCSHVYTDTWFHPIQKTGLGLQVEGNDVYIKFKTTDSLKRIEIFINDLRIYMANRSYYGDQKGVILTTN